MPMRGSRRWRARGGSVGGSSVVMELAREDSAQCDMADEDALCASVC